MMYNAASPGCICVMSTIKMWIFKTLMTKVEQAADDCGFIWASSAFEMSYNSLKREKKKKKLCLMDFCLKR